MVFSVKMKFSKEEKNEIELDSFRNFPFVCVRFTQMTNVCVCQKPEARILVSQTEKKTSIDQSIN